MTLLIPKVHRIWAKIDARRGRDAIVSLPAGTSRAQAPRYLRGKRLFPKRINYYIFDSAYSSAVGQQMALVVSVEVCQIVGGVTQGHQFIQGGDERITGLAQGTRSVIQQLKAIGCYHLH